MKVEKKDLPKSQVELVVELTFEEFEPYIKRGAEKVSAEVKVEGFRPGKVPFDILKQKIGEMTIIEEGARIAIDKNLEKIFKDHITGEPVGQPQVEITKLAPNNALEFKITVAILPEIKLGDYKDIKVKARKSDIKNEDIEKMIGELQEMRVKEAIVDREIKDGDKVIADINMFLDNVPIEGGQGKDAALIIGKNYIIPGFDKHLLGAKKEDTREFSQLYPEDHHMKNISGKMVDFKVKIKEVYGRELPTVDDEFAIGFGLKNLADLKDNIKKSLTEQADKENEQKMEKEIIEKILEKSRFNDLPELLIEHEAKTMMAELEQSVTNQGGKFGDYLSSINKTEEQIMLDMLPEAIKRVKVSLLIKEIAKKENIQASVEEANKQIEEIKNYYKDKNDILEKVSSLEYKSYIYSVLSSRKVIDKLREWNVEKN
jgi:trigger factor